MEYTHRANQFIGIDRRAQCDTILANVHLGAVPNHADDAVELAVGCCRTASTTECDKVTIRLLLSCGITHYDSVNAYAIRFEELIAVDITL